MTPTSYAWAPITKVEEQDDGTVIVYGSATDAGLDRDKQRMNQAWLDTAMPAWMAEGANVREMHDSKRAVGVGVGLTRADDGAHMLAAAVVDPVAITKVRPVLNEDGTVKRPAVLKGFSVGIKDPHVTYGKADAPNGEIDGGAIIEVSLVDRPSNPRTLFTMVKADGAGELTEVEEPEVEEVEPDALKSDTAAKAEQILADLATLVPDLAKADQSADIATAQQAIAVVAKLIQSEAGSLAAGQLSDAYDIKCLLDAVCALKYFIQCEGQEVSSTTTGGDSLQANIADSMDIAGSAYDMTGKAEEMPDVTKVENAGLADIVKAAVAEANAPLKEEITLLKADLAKVKAMPEPGGPVAMRTASQTVAARGVDAFSLRREAERLIAKADDTAREDPTYARGLRDRAAELLAKADA